MVSKIGRPRLGANTRPGSKGYRYITRDDGTRMLLHRSVLLDKIGPGEHKCHWCRTIVSWDKTWPRDHRALIADHVDKDRDNNTPENLVASCSSCNSRRGKGELSKLRLNI